jgi:NAD(P)-dependent dehydrogenase (short-subunit alcohol dehydrogenase family)
MAGLLEGKVIVVTGAAGGIGRATSLVLVRAGAKVLVADISTRRGEETLKLVREAGGDAEFFKCDVSRQADAEAVVAAAVEKWGRLDCAFNNVGISGDIVLTAEDNEENWDHVFAVNLKGVWLCMKYEIQQMLRQGGGSIVNTSSTAGLLAAPRMGAYSATKHGVIGITKTAAVEYARQNIRVNVVCPGLTETPPMVRWMDREPGLRQQLLAAEPIGRGANPTEIGAAVAWLFSDAASFVTGATIPVDGGLTAQ